MITKYNIYESIENNKFDLCFYFSKINHKVFTLKYSIQFYNIRILKNNGMLAFLTKQIDEYLKTTIFKDKPLYKHSTNIYTFNKKDITFTLINLQLIGYPKSKPFQMISHTKQRLDVLLNSTYDSIEQDCYVFIKEYDNVNLLKEEFKNYPDDIDIYVEKMLDMNDMFYLNNLFKIIMNDDIKKKYRYFDDAKNFDIL